MVRAAIKSSGYSHIEAVTYLAVKELCGAATVYFINGFGFAPYPAYGTPNLGTRIDCGKCPLSG